MKGNRKNEILYIYLYVNYKDIVSFDIFFLLLKWWLFINICNVFEFIVECDRF